MDMTTAEWAELPKYSAVGSKVETLHIALVLCSGAKHYLIPLLSIIDFQESLSSAYRPEIPTENTVFTTICLQQVKSFVEGYPEFLTGVYSVLMFFQ